MKTFIKWIASIFALLVLVILAVPFFVPLDSVKDIVKKQVREATGRELTIEGNVKTALWPNIGIKLQSVTLSNPEGFKNKNMAEIGDITVEIATLPLLQGEIEISKFIVNKPIIHLEVNKNGNNNWEFSPQKKLDKDPVAEEEIITEKTEQRKQVSKIPALGTIEINGGNFGYNDATNGKSYNIKNTDLVIKMPSSDSELDITSNMNLNENTINISFNAKQPNLLMAGKTDEVKLAVKSGSKLNFTFTGKTDLKNANGQVDIKSDSLIALSSVVGKKIEWKGSTPLAFAASSNINCNQSECVLDKLQFAVDDTTLNGDLKIGFSGKPSISGSLENKKLDLNNYITSSLFKPERNYNIARLLINPAHAAQNGWSKERIDLSALNFVDLDIKLSIESLLYQASTISNITSIIKLSGGKLSVNIPSAELYSGKAQLALTADTKNAVSLAFGTEKLQIEPLLKDFVNFDRLTGTAKANISVSGNGLSQYDIISSLGGNGNIHITDGTIKGIDIERLVSDAKTLVTGEEGTSQKTSFSELGGSFTISQGIVKNDDLSMKAPLLRMKGEGTVDLTNRYVNYRLFPSLVATLKGQGGKDKTGLEIPFIVEGNFERLKFTPDLRAAAQEALKDPEKIKENIRNLKDTTKDVKEIIKNPDAVKDLLHGLR